ncbi:hypothetical protein ACH4M4_37955 [Streptomyces sp. NPDC017254]|uniref:hypothetical protein n=1 Tax=unclassified Streptomyces TaxID=2593676 RepID=UPI00379A7AD7
MSRALLRDERLTSEERAARDSARPQRTPPSEQILAFDPLLRAAGWEVEVSTHPLRTRLDAFHSSGAAVMITADLRRRSNRGSASVYILHAPGSGSWRRLRSVHLAHFATHLHLPPDVRDHVVRASKCHCGKVQHPTAARAASALAQVAAKRVAEGAPRPPERRYYRCEADDRVWHLTSAVGGYTHPVPLADAFRDQRRPPTRASSPPSSAHLNLKPTVRATGLRPSH